MSTSSFDGSEGACYLTGERVPPGFYRDLCGGQDIWLERADFLPAPREGHVRCYQRLSLEAQEPPVGEQA